MKPKKNKDYLKIPLLPRSLWEKEEQFVELQRSYRVYKKVFLFSKKYGRNWYYDKEIICTLILPAGTTIYTGHIERLRKMRADQAIVVDLCGETKAHSERLQSFKYPLDEMVFPQRPFSSFKKSCSSGIHFFVTEQEAKDW